MLRLTYHSLPFSGGTDVTQDAEFVFEFDAPMDLESVRDAITLEDLTREETIPGVGATLVSPRRLSVAPFAGGDFRPGTPLPPDAPGVRPRRRTRASSGRR